MWNTAPLKDSESPIHCKDPSGPSLNTSNRVSARPCLESPIEGESYLVPFPCVYPGDTLHPELRLRICGWFSQPVRVCNRNTCTRESGKDGEASFFANLNIVNGLTVTARAWLLHRTGTFSRGSFASVQSEASAFRV